MEITKQEFEKALDVVKKYKQQEWIKLKSKKTILDTVLDLNKLERDIFLDFIFNGNLELKYSIVVNRIYYYLNNVLLLKIGIINTKKLFKEYLKNDFIVKKEQNNKYSVYHKSL